MAGRCDSENAWVVRIFYIVYSGPLSGRAVAERDAKLEQKGFQTCGRFPSRGAAAVQTIAVLDTFRGHRRWKSNSERAATWGVRAGQRRQFRGGCRTEAGLCCRMEWAGAGGGRSGEPTKPRRW